MGIYYKECFLEDIYHFEALDVWEKLKLKAHVELFYDYKNADYRNNIKVKFVADRNDVKILGVLSEDDSKSMLPFFKGGWNDVFCGQVCFVQDKKEEQRIKIVVYVKSKTAEQQ